MYRDEDIDRIKLNIDNIAEQALTIYKTNYEPTLSESNEVYKELLNFIREKKRIIYGGFAQNSLILMKNKNDGFYKEIDTPDVEFYSYEPVKDLYDLCDYLKSKNFKYIQGASGVHTGTYKIYVNFTNYCDITYMPKNIYDNCKFIESPEKVKFTHPNFMLLDIYRVFTDPMTSYSFRLDKTFKRYLKLYKYYPITSATNDIRFSKLSDENILKTIRKSIIHNSNYVVVGAYAYNYYVSKINKKDLIKINFYEIITENIAPNTNKIYKILQKQFGSKITVKEYTPFFEFFDYRVEFLYENTVILRVYNNNNRCIVYNESDKKKTKFGTNQIVLLYLLSNYNYYLINRNTLESNNYLNMFMKLNSAKNKYLDKHNITVLDSSPFQDFKFKCIGQPVDLIRKNRLSMVDKKKNGKQLTFRYDPGDKPVKIPEYIFDNVSGNEVLNNKNLIIKK
tara:strand:- start:64 stop:1416 length:1353 start_codon:yes stop_codon:yes gene_type:complete